MTISLKKHSFNKLLLCFFPFPASLCLLHFGLHEDCLYSVGDSSAHGLTDDHGSPKVLKAMSVVASEAHKVFPDIPIFPAIGNNDFPGHYVLLNNTNWYKTALSYWASLILCSDCPRNVERPTTVEELTKTFLEDGYCKVNIAGEIQAFH